VNVRSPRRFVVTGAGGFIGRALMRGLSERGIDALGLAHSEGYDVLRDDPPLRADDVVVHLAALTGVPESWRRPDAFHRVNALGTHRVLEQCRRAGCALVFMSAYVYGRPEHLPVDEHAAVDPMNPYALSKVLAEEVCLFYARHFGVDATIVRMFNVFGPGQTSAFVIPRIVEQAIDRATESIDLADLAPRRDYLYVTDAAEALIAVALGGAHAQIYNVGSGRSYSVAEVAELVLQIAGVQKRVRATGERRPGEIMDVVADTSALRHATGWSPRISLREGLQHVITAMSGR
jgi:nucleoside-diphosphate-sugar epimerase